MEYGTHQLQLKHDICVPHLQYTDHELHTQFCGTRVTLRVVQF